MKPINDRPTPLTDRAEIFFHDGDIIGYVKADFSRQLEQMCAELAKAVGSLTSVHNLNWPGSKKCKCADCAALARYNEMMKGVKHDNG